ncbi:MAG: Brp/Blh family beta-carotene 15,15'-dioxygenase [Haloferacaceae archaeon]
MSAPDVTRLGRSVSRASDEPVPLAVSRLSLLAVLLAVGGARAAGLAVPDRPQWALYLLGMVAMNLPHGGYEHLDNLRRRTAGFQARYVAAYLALAGGFVVLLFLSPLLGLALACGVVVAKGGHGDVAVLDAVGASAHLQTRPQRALAALVRGGAPMAVGLWAFPTDFHVFSSLMVGVFGGSLGPVAGQFTTTRSLVGGAYALALLAHLSLGYARGGGRSWRVDAGESLLLGAYFAVVPVVLAVGLYFPFWYSARQVARARAVETDPFDDRQSEGPFALLDAEDPRTVALGAWGVLVGGALVTGTLAAGLFWLAPNPLGGGPPLAGGVAFWSLFVSVIALPHVVVGSWLDTERGIWYVP